jgi:hypothetical protein
MKREKDSRPQTSSPLSRGTGGSGGHFSAGDGEKSGRRELTRRALLSVGGLAGIGLVVGAIAVDSRINDSAKGTLSQASTDTLAFASTDATTARWVTTQTGETAPGLLFVTPQTKGSSGVISDNLGQPFWMAGATTGMSDLRVQQYAGTPVLTYWSGTRIRGYGSGVGNILNAQYEPVAVVHAAPGLQMDLHEFQLTPRGTALVIAYTAKKADLSAVHGPSAGYLLDCHVNEIDIQTGKVLLDWSAHEHIPLADTFAAIGDLDGDGKTSATAFDAYHLSSIDFDSDSLYVSARNTHAVYKIDRSSGTVQWRLGGRKSDFTIAKDAAFAWQNHFRLRPDGTASLFNNRSRTQVTGVRSAAFLLNIDTDTKAVTLQKKFEHGPLLSTDMGSAELLDNGNWLVGWGSQPFVTEHAPDGKAVYTSTLATSPSDRAFRGAWVGSPRTQPVVEIVHGTGRNMLVNVSWNGATEVRNWRYLSGATSTGLQPIKVVPRSDFETTGTIARAPYAAAQALDLNGNVLGTAAAVASD